MVVMAGRLHVEATESLACYLTQPIASTKALRHAVYLSIGATMYTPLFAGAGSSSTRQPVAAQFSPANARAF
jgi:hypothetical protein